jgi:membrane protein implicated in regulation of membrane protease activity
MINSVLSFLAPGPYELLIILFVFLGVPVLLVVLVVRYVLRTGRESRKLRLEVGKLADELEQMRKQAKGVQKPDVSSQSR